MRRTFCSACGGEQLDVFLDLGKSPVADAYADTAEESIALERYPLEVAVCGKCRLVQLLEVLPQEQLFGTGYHFYSSASPPLVDYHRRYAEDVLEVPLDDQLMRHYVIEVGCNDGDFLRHFDAAGHYTLGIDPALGPAEVARARGLDVRVRPFGLSFAHDLLNARGPATIVIANHVLAHVADVADVLAGIATVLDEKLGVAYVEVQYLPDLLVGNAFDLVYHEHRNFFSLTSLEAAATRHGLYVRDVTFTGRQGGSIRVELTRRKSIQSWTVKECQAHETWLQNPAVYEGMQGRVERIRARLQYELEKLDAANVDVIGYGAPAKATTLLNYVGWSPRRIVDTTSAKQGRFLPGCTTQIVPPRVVRRAAQRAGSSDNVVYLVLAWNYLREIMRSNRDFEGRWLVPLPVPVML